MNISLIAAVDTCMGLGKDNQLLCYLPADLRYFKQQTLHKPIIMGYRTFLSIGKALPERKNIVLSTKQRSPMEGVIFVNDWAEAIKRAGDEPEIMVIGGASVYRQALPYANKLYLTVIEHHFDADVFFPAVDKNEWHKILNEPHARDEKNPYNYRFTVWQRKVN